MNPTTILTTGLASPTERLLKAPYLGVLGWQIEYGKAVCLQCQVTIGGDKNSIRRHFLVQHQVPTPTTQTGISKQLKEWKSLFKDIPVKKVTNDLILERPIEGLKVVRAFMCGQCPKTALSAKTIRNHCAIAHHDAKSMKQIDASIYSLKKPPIPICVPQPQPPMQNNIQEAMEAISFRSQALLNAETSTSSRSSTVNEFITPIEVSPLYSKLLRWFPLPEASTIGDYNQFDDSSGMRAQALARCRVDSQTGEAFGVRLNASAGGIPVSVPLQRLALLARPPPGNISKPVSASSSTNQPVRLVDSVNSQSPLSPDEVQMASFCRLMEIAFEVFVACLAISSDRIRRLFNDSRATQFLNGCEGTISLETGEVQYRREALRPLHRHSLVVYRSFAIRLAAYLLRASQLNDPALKYWMLPPPITDIIKEICDERNQHNHCVILKICSLIISLAKWKVGPGTYSLFGRFLHACAVGSQHGHLVAPASMRKYAAMLMYLLRIAVHAHFLFEYHGSRLWQRVDIPEQPIQASPFHHNELREDDEDEVSSSDEADYDSDDDDQRSGLNSTSRLDTIESEQHEKEVEDEREDRLRTILRSNLSVLVRSNDTIQDLLTIGALSRNQAERDMETNPQIKELGNGNIDVDGFIAPIRGLSLCFFAICEETKNLILEEILGGLTSALPEVEVQLDVIGARQPLYQPLYRFKPFDEELSIKTRDELERRATLYWRETLQCGSHVSNIGFFSAIRSGALSSDCQTLANREKAQGFLIDCDRLCDLFAVLMYLGSSGSIRGSELARTTVQNGVDDSLRSLIFDHEEKVWANSSSSANTKTGRPVVRHLLPNLSKLLTFYLGTLRPVHLTIAIALKGSQDLHNLPPQKIKNAFRWLFVKGGLRRQEHEICSVIGTKLTRCLNSYLSNISIGSYVGPITAGASYFGVRRARQMMSYTLKLVRRDFMSGQLGIVIQHIRDHAIRHGFTLGLQRMNRSHLSRQQIEEENDPLYYVRHLNEVLEGYQRMSDSQNENICDELLRSLETHHSGHSERTFSAMYGVAFEREESTTRRWQLSRLVASRFVGFLYILLEVPLYGVRREQVLDHINRSTPSPHHVEPLEKRQRTTTTVTWDDQLSDLDHLDLLTGGLLSAQSRERINQVSTTTSTLASTFESSESLQRDEHSDYSQWDDFYENTSVNEPSIRDDYCNTDSLSTPRSSGSSSFDNNDSPPSFSTVSSASSTNAYQTISPSPSPSPSPESLFLSTSITESLNRALTTIGATDSKLRFQQQYDAAVRVLSYLSKDQPAMTLLVSPTGSGKTKVVEAIVEAAKGIALIVVPFNVLLEDQIRRRNDDRAVGPTAIMWNYQTRDRLLQWSLEKTRHQPLKSFENLRMIYVTPESLHGYERQLTSFVNNLLQNRQPHGVCCFVIDEAHHVIVDAKFRERYTQLSVFFGKWPTVPILAMSATIPPSMERELCQTLSIDRQAYRIFRAPSDRPNCRYIVKTFSVSTFSSSSSSSSSSPSSCSSSSSSQKGWGISKEARVLKELEAAAEAIVSTIQKIKSERRLDSFKTIVYCLSQREALSLPAKIESISKRKISAISVIGSLSASSNEQHRARFVEQQRNIQRWRQGEIDVVCATSSFIEGQDQSDVRLVIFLEGAYDLISLVQGFGRVSRDGLPGDCVLLIRKDRRSPTTLASQSYASSIECRRRYLIREMDGHDQPTCLDLRHTRCQLCDNCMISFSLIQAESQLNVSSQEVIVNSESRDSTSNDASLLDSSTEETDHEKEESAEMTLVFVQKTRSLRQRSAVHKVIPNTTIF